MIKIIAFDLVGVLVKEKEIELTDVEEKLERMFGPNLNDNQYLLDGKKYVNDNILLIETTKNIIDKLYEVREDNLFKNIKSIYPEIKIVIATNHVSYVKKYIVETFGKKYLDDIIISAEINKIKPNKDFYEYLVKKYNVNSEEILFLDDNMNNVIGAKEIGINAIRYSREMSLLETVLGFMKEFKQKNR